MCHLWLPITFWWIVRQIIISNNFFYFYAFSILLIFMVENYWIIFLLDFKNPYRNLNMINLAICSTIFGTETRFQDLFHFLGSCSTFLGRCSTKSGTVPLCVGLLGYCQYPRGHLGGAIYITEGASLRKTYIRIVPIRALSLFSSINLWADKNCVKTDGWHRNDWQIEK